MPLSLLYLANTVHGERVQMWTHAVSPQSSPFHLHTLCRGAWWAKSVEEGRLREPSVELPHVASQSLLSCLWHLQIKEVLKLGACDTRVSFRVAQFLCSPNCRIQSQTPWSGFHTAHTRTYNSSCSKARGKTGGQPEAHDRQVNPWLGPVPSSTLHGTCQCSVQACMLLISTQLLLVEDSSSSPQGWNTGERQG